MFYKIIKFFAALGIGIMALALVSVLFTDWQRAGPLAIGLSLLVGLYSSLSAAIQRRRELALRRPEVLASPPAALAAELVEASPITCYSLTRGTGALSLDESGSLHFRADPKIPWRGWPPKALRRLSQAERSVTISRDQVRVAVPFDHLASGPSVVIGYGTPGNGLRWDEFILATSPRPEPGGYYPQPTGDAQVWARALGPGAGAPELQREAARYRRRLRRRMNLFLVKIVALAAAAVFVLVFGMVALGVAYDGRHTVPQALAVALAAGGGIWLATVLLSGLIIVAVNR